MSLIGPSRHSRLVRETVAIGGAADIELTNAECSVAFDPTATWLDRIPHGS